MTAGPGGSGSGGGETDESAAIAALVRDLAENGRRATRTEIDRPRAYFASWALRRQPNVALPHPDLEGWEWGEGRIATGRYMDRLGSKYLYHAVWGEEWPAGTSPEAYLDSLEATIRSESGGIYVERFEDEDPAWRLVFVARSGRSRGPGGAAYMLVTFLAEEGRWLTGFQPPGGLDYMARQRARRSGRWLRRPS